MLAAATIEQTFADIEYRCVGGNAASLSISNVVDDTRELSEGDWFLVRNGQAGSGERYAHQALAAGAAGLIDGKELAVDAPQLIVENLEAQKDKIIETVYPDFSRVKLVGITGTDGKTSVSMMLAQAIAEIEGDCGISGTIGIGTHRSAKASRLTTPSNVALKRWLHETRGAGNDYAVMEVSSHALDQARVAGLPFACAAITNIARDHLDYHGTLEAYRAAKQRLFTEHDPEVVVYFVDDVSLSEMMASVEVSRLWPISAGEAKARNALQIVEHRFDGQLSMVFEAREGRYEFTLPLVGDFQYQNVAIVLQLLRGLNFDKVAIERAISAIRPIAGRMQMVETAADTPLVVIDYSHTAQAIENALKALRPIASARSGKLSIVFGCGGDRDPGKRPEMAKVAEAFADKVILTSDNPRTESPEQIVADARKGFAAPDAQICIVDRRAAIAEAIKQADISDVVLIAGKGHETYQEIDGQRYPFSDYDEALVALEEFWK